MKKTFLSEKNEWKLVRLRIFCVTFTGQAAGLWFVNAQFEFAPRNAHLFLGAMVPKKHSSSLHLLEKTIPGKNFFSLFHCNSISQLGFYDPFFFFTNFILCPWKVANSHSCVLFWTNTEWFYCKNESLFSRTAKDAFHGTKFLNFVW